MAAACLNTDLLILSHWAATWLVLFNPTKTESLIFSRKLNKPLHPPIFMENQQIVAVESHKHLGVILSADCTWHKHIKYITDKAWVRINVMRRLKFKLDTKSLEIIYTTFIRPLLEYSDVIWDNCTRYEKQELDKIQNEAARIATGATKLISLENLQDEVKWQPLQKRRDNHKLTLFYKMNNNITPSYLSDLVPGTVSTATSSDFIWDFGKLHFPTHLGKYFIKIGKVRAKIHEIGKIKAIFGLGMTPIYGLKNGQIKSLTRYKLRNSNNIMTIRGRTNSYLSSFLPSTVRDWNNLPPEIAQSDSVASFKYNLNRDRTHVPKYFYSGNRHVQVLHTRLRTQCSALNNDLFKKNISDTPLCRCGSIENTHHFFFKCPFYNIVRNDLLHEVSTLHDVSLKLLLYGNPNLSNDLNTRVFESVHKYILKTKRFSSN